MFHLLTAKTCKDKIDDCDKQKAIEKTSDYTKKCKLAKKWRSCLEGLMAECNLQASSFPFELAAAESANCYRTPGEKILEPYTHAYCFSPLLSTRSFICMQYKNQLLFQRLFPILFSTTSSINIDKCSEEEL